MARKPVVPKPKPQPSQEGRRGAVFAIRVSPAQRAELQRAADHDLDLYRTPPAPLGPWVLQAALQAARVTLASRSSKSARLRKANGRAAGKYAGARRSMWSTR